MPFILVNRSLRFSNDSQCMSFSPGVQVNFLVGGLWFYTEDMKPDVNSHQFDSHCGAKDDLARSLHQASDDSVDASSHNTRRTQPIMSILFVVLSFGLGLKLLPCSCRTHQICSNFIMYEVL